MSEMLANQYFMIRRYSDAKTVYEDVLSKVNFDFNIAKKLIICYSLTNEIEKAIHLFHNIIKSNPEIIINTRIEEEDCPCPEIIPKIFSNEIMFNNEDEKNLVLGILSLYCNIKDSQKFFEVINTNNFADKIFIEEIISIIKKIKQKH